jgi:hypothetical protein
VRILLDNCVHKKAASFFAGHDVSTAGKMGWAALSNGNLLRQAAAGGFDLMVTTDKNLRYQHDLSGLPLTVLELHSVDTRWPALEVLRPFIGEALALAAGYRFVAVHPEGRVEALSPR